MREDIIRLAQHNNDKTYRCKMTIIRDQKIKIKIINKKEINQLGKTYQLGRIYPNILKIYSLLDFITPHTNDYLFQNKERSCIFVDGTHVFVFLMVLKAKGGMAERNFLNKYFNLRCPVQDILYLKQFQNLIQSLNLILHRN